MVLMLAVLASSTLSICPREVTGQVTMEDVPGWELYVERSTHPLSQVGIFVAHPRNKVGMKPKGIEVDHEEIVHTHDMASYGQDLWVECRYHGTAIRLVRELPPGLTQCVVKLQRISSLVTLAECS